MTDMIDEIERIVDAYVQKIRSDVARIESRVGDLGVEMASVERAVEAMHAGLAHRLGDLHEVNRDLVKIGHATRGDLAGANTRLDGLQETNRTLVQLGEITQGQLVAANTQLGVGNVQLRRLRRENSSGFTKVSQDIEQVDGDLQRATAGVVQMEVIRRLTEAQAPIERIHGFSDEIRQRFAKALESAQFVRGQYDQLLANVSEEFENKLRRIGEHIYRIYDDEFQTYAERPLTLSPRPPVALPLAVDEEQVQARTKVLGQADARLRADGLGPLQAAVRAFEQLVGEEFASDVPADMQEWSVPAAFLIHEAPHARRIEFVADASVSAAADGPGPRLLASEAGTRLAAQLEASTPRLAREWRGRALSADEVAAVKRHLREFANRGYVDAALLPGYDAYLDAGRLEVPDVAPESFEVVFDDGGGLTPNEASA